jgi:hypothetical protein
MSRVFDYSGSLLSRRLDVGRRGLGWLPRVDGGMPFCDINVGRAGRVSGHRLAHQAVGAETCRVVRGSFSSAIRASVRGGGHGETPWARRHLRQGRSPNRSLDTATVASGALWQKCGPETPGRSTHHICRVRLRTQKAHWRADWLRSSLVFVRLTPERRARRA